MTRFFDSSAVVAAYAQQASTARARELLGTDGVAVSRLTQVETISALARLAREGRIPETDRDAAIAAFLTDYAGWYILELTPEVTALAKELLLRHPLRASDAIQLASALLVHSRDATALDAFVAFDRRLAAVARGERLTVMDG
ncbi:MAG TPA: type II toxin-antitoxin system VapC family toxin [Gemmatimonadaceae bacterium]|nr:type II toxin-antitoxin system VapC family toxin [Gemmatimonadaceae bacterium]